MRLLSHQDALLREYAEEITRLKQLLEKYTSGSLPAGGDASGTGPAAGSASAAGAMAAMDDLKQLANFVAAANVEGFPRAVDVDREDHDKDHKDETNEV